MSFSDIIKTLITKAKKPPSNWYLSLKVNREWISNTPVSGIFIDYDPQPQLKAWKKL